MKNNGSLKRNFVWTAAMVALLGIAPVNADVKDLGKTLTPIGAERAGNVEGTIPKWTGETSQLMGNENNGGKRVNQFAHEAPLFSIDRSSLDQHKKHLSEGQRALIKKYDGYHMNVYPSHRTCHYPDRIYKATRRNASVAALNEEGDLLSGIGGFLFPIPKTGAEAVWNHKVRYEGLGAIGSMVTASVSPKGNYALGVLKRETYNDFYDPSITSFSGLDGVLARFRQEIKEPAKLAGSITLVHEALNDERSTWVYSAGSRRVRRMPTFTYDNPVNGTSGLMTNDQASMFNGRMDRYDWELKGKEEMYIPYNDADLHSSAINYADILSAKYPNRDVFRYELHRTWHVTATLKSNRRHLYLRRELYLDEDSWLIAVADLYDARGEVWRVQEAPIGLIPQLPACLSEAQFHYDLDAEQYIASQLNNQEPGFDYLAAQEGRVKKASFTPGYLQMVGRR